MFKANSPRRAAGEYDGPPQTARRRCTCLLCAVPTLGVTHRRTA